MSISVIQTWANTPATSATISATTANSLLVVWHAAITTGAIVTDNQSNTYTLLYALPTTLHGAPVFTSISFLANCPSGITSVSVSGATQEGIICVREYSAGGGGFFVNDQDGQTANATSGSSSGTLTVALPNTFTPTNNNSLLVGGASVFSTSNPLFSVSSTPTGFTSLNSGNPTVTSKAFSVAFDWIQTSATGTTASTAFSFSGAGAGPNAGLAMLCFTLAPCLGWML